MSCCLMQLLDSVSQNQKFERLIGLEKVFKRTLKIEWWLRLFFSFEILVQALGTNAGPSPFSIVLQTLKEDLNKSEEQRYKFNIEQTYWTINDRFVFLEYWSYSIMWLFLFTFIH